jgi:hypothetical protein
MAIDAFPDGATSLRVRLTTNPRPTDGLPPRGVEGLRPGVIAFPRVEILQTADDGFQPLVAVYTCDFVGPTDCSEGPVGIDALNECSVWLLKLVDDGPAGVVNPIPPVFEIQVRASFGCVGEPLVKGVVNVTSFADRGLLVQVSGILCTQWELWGRIIDQRFPLGAKVWARFGMVVDRMGGGIFSGKAGSLVTLI